MAGNVRYTAILDACVLYPICVADALMSLGVAGLYAPKWSVQIEDEWMRNLEADRPDLSGRLEVRRQQMRQAIPDWEVAQPSIDSVSHGLVLPDMGDVHVLAAAIAGHADCIVTANQSDFPTDVLAVHGLEVIHPDDFVVAQLDLDHITALGALKEMRGRSRKPPFTPEEFAEAFRRSGLATTAERIIEASALI